MNQSHSQKMKECHQKIYSNYDYTFLNSSYCFCISSTPSISSPTSSNWTTDSWKTVVKLISTLNPSHIIVQRICQRSPDAQLNTRALCAKPRLKKCLNSCQLHFSYVILHFRLQLGNQMLLSYHVTKKSNIKF